MRGPGPIRPGVRNLFRPTPSLSFRTHVPHPPPTTPTAPRARRSRGVRHPRGGSSTARLGGTCLARRRGPAPGVVPGGGIARGGHPPHRRCERDVPARYGGRASRLGQPSARRPPTGVRRRSRHIGHSRRTAPAATPRARGLGRSVPPALPLARPLNAARPPRTTFATALRRRSQTSAQATQPNSAQTTHARGAQTHARKRRPDPRTQEAPKPRTQQRPNHAPAPTRGWNLKTRRTAARLDR